MSTLNVATVKSLNTLPPAVQNSSGTEIGTFCRAWVNFNGTGTVAIRASFNVSSITDNGTGAYSVNFTTPMTDANYSKNVTCSFFYTSAHSIVNTDVNVTGGTEIAPTASSFSFVCSTNVSGTGDAKYVSVSVFR